MKSLSTTPQPHSSSTLRNNEPTLVANEHSWTVGLVSDFNLDNLASLLRNSSELPSVQPVVAPFGQTVPTLMGANAEFWEQDPDVLVVWTRPEAAVETFNQTLTFKSVSAAKIREEVDEFCGLVSKAADGLKAVFVPCWTLPPLLRGLGLIDLSHPSGLFGTLLRMNSTLIENFQESGSIFVLNAQGWLSRVGADCYSPRLWYMSKTPFDTETFKVAAEEIKAALRALQGLTRKLIVVDLDETLWGGIVGEVGWRNLRLGGHDPVGEAYLDFQKALKDLTNRGVLLGIASKNEESNALEAIARHPE